MEELLRELQDRMFHEGMQSRPAGTVLSSLQLDICTVFVAAQLKPRVTVPCEHACPACGWHGLLVEWKNEVSYAGQPRRVAGPLARPATAQDVWQRGASAATDEDLGDWRRPGSAFGTDQLDAITACSKLCFLHALQAVRPCACIHMSKRCSKAVQQGSCWLLSRNRRQAHAQLCLAEQVPHPMRTPFAPSWARRRSVGSRSGGPINTPMPA